MAALYAKGKLSLNQEFHHEGLLGTIFVRRLIGETQVGNFRAVIPTIRGQPWITDLLGMSLTPMTYFPTGLHWAISGAMQWNNPWRITPGALIGTIGLGLVSSAKSNVPKINCLLHNTGQYKLE